MADNDQKPVSVSKEDIEKNKLYAVLCYLGILILVPLLMEDVKKSPFVKFHLNQGLVMLIAGIIVGFISWIPVIGWLVGIAWLVIWIMAVVWAATGQMKRLPLIGNIELLK